MPVLLLVSAASPSTTVARLAYPSERVINWKRGSIRKQREARRAERWVAVHQAAERRDADGLANVGFTVLYGGKDPLYPAVELDSIRGWHMLRQASDGGSIPAAFWL